MPSALPHVNAGRLRVIAIGSPRRSPTLPDVPTVAESGLPGFDIGAWNGILAPAARRRAHRAAQCGDRQNDERSRDQGARSSQGAELVSDTPQEFTAYIKAQMRVLRRS